MSAKAAKGKGAAPTGARRRETAPSAPQAIPDVLEGKWEVEPEGEGVLLDRFIREHLGGLPWSRVRGLIERSHVTVNDEICLSPTAEVRPGDFVQLHRGARRGNVQRHSGEGIEIAYQDSQLVVAVKPAGISTVPFDQKEKGTLLDRLQSQLHTGRKGLSVVHRIDKETSGLLVFAKTLSAKDHLKNQFRFHTTGRLYWALVQGHPRSGTIQSRLIRDRGDGRRGSVDNELLGKDSVTHVEVLERFDRASLIACRLETGRTHQIRIHLSEEGHPLLGEKVYSKNFEGPLLPAPRVMLHARTLEFTHPVSERRLSFEREVPADFAAVLDKLRARRD